MALLFVVATPVSRVAADETNDFTRYIERIRESSDALRDSPNVHMWTIQGLWSYKKTAAEGSTSWRLFVEGGSPVIVLYRGFEPKMLIEDRETLVHVGNDRWVMDKKNPWSFLMDRGRVTDFMSEGPVEDGEKQFVRDLASSLARILDPELTAGLIPLPEYGAYEFTYIPRNSTVRVRSYCPTDQLRTGVWLADTTILFTQIEDVLASFRNRGLKLLSQNELKTIPHINDAVIRKLQVVPKDEYEPASPESENDQRRFRSHALWSELLADPERSKLPCDQLENPLAKIGRVRQLPGTIIEKLPAYEFLEEATKCLIACRLKDVSESLTADEVATIDPGLKWLSLSRKINPVALQQVYDDLTIPVYVDKHIDEDELTTIIRFYDALGDAGEPDLPSPLFIFEKFHPKLPIARLLGLGLSARWMIPVPEDSAQYVKSLLDAEGKHEETTCFAVETLIRIDRANGIAKEDFETYWNKKVRSVSDAARWAELSEIARTKTGRQWLLRAISNGTDDNEDVVVLRNTKRVLKKYAESTRALERWDFMSRQECNRLLDEMQM